jgi:hypothetical protein
MKMLKRALLMVVVLLLGKSLALAVPINYEVSGSIVYQNISGEMVSEALSGSFTLSDPNITYDLYNDYDPRYQIDLYTYNLTNINLTAETFDLFGTGDFWIKSDQIDRYFNLQLNDYFTPAYEHIVIFSNHQYNQQPEMIDFGSFDLIQNSSSWAYGVSMSANRIESVPEPGALQIMLIWGGIVLGVRGKKHLIKAC